MEPKNWRTKYQDHRSFWQFNFNAWLSVNLIIILSNHPINVFYIYNDHQVSSPFLHHLSGVRYWNREGPWQNVREASWLRRRRRCVAALGVCIRLWRRSRWCSSIRSFTLGRACSRKHRRRERQTKRSGGERMVKGFHASSSASLLCCLLWGESGAPCQWVTSTQIHRAGDAGAIYHDLMSLLPSSLLANRQLWRSRSESRSPNTSNEGLGSTERDTFTKGFPSGVWQLGVYTPVVIKHSRVCFVLREILASDHPQSVTVR